MAIIHKTAAIRSESPPITSRTIRSGRSRKPTLQAGIIDSARARAENTIPSCKVGFLERPERIVLLIIGALFDRMAPVLWVIAILGNLTVIHRMVFTWQESKRLEEAQLRVPAGSESR